LTHVTFSTRRATCPPDKVNDVLLPQSDEVNYLGLHLDRRLTWHKHIFTKRKQLGLTLTKMHWLHGPKSQLSTTNKFLLYKTMLKPIWTYGIQQLGTASTSNIEILERFQSKVLRIIVDASWYVPNSLIRRDLSCPAVKEEIRFLLLGVASCCASIQLVPYDDVDRNKVSIRQLVFIFSFLTTCFGPYGPSSGEICNWIF
jgi:hypothetical protein